MLLRSVPRAGAAVLATCLLALLGVLLGGCASPTVVPAAHSSGRAAHASSTPAWADGHHVVHPADLPPEARTTLTLIDRGGPYPYSRDGIVFGNYEKELPARTRGYYHEYTVPTPDAPDRGARRLVTGRNGEIFYTSDHYQSFEAVLR
ncbi:ribonuclease domain-containing protein [Streptomyces sp. CBMA29]|uniref:ribonuclease domain-containing protein n=1 Tax=Streptomyces sp. CBMA29 TaxID=1896314 RepID=UPI001661A638|nr:ribonuclease domain-containing protein [Streptomyces sp. CBMA29]MBD0734548.1 hypothetical protein [Streptomyces sp. CBMA29]